MPPIPTLRLFNTPAMNQQQQQQLQQRQAFDATSSILSDYDELEILDDQSLYVLFNPKSAQTKSDILSLTNTSKDEYRSDTEQESEADEEEDGEEEDEEDELNRTDVIDRDNLSNKINSWYTSNVVSSSHHLIDEKVASWELDEEEAVPQRPQQAPVTTLLEESKTLLKEFYGDDLFKYLDQEDIAKFRKFHKMTDIKNYLLNKNEGNASLLDQILYRVLLMKEHKQCDLLLHRKFNVGTTDYINYLTKDKIPQTACNTYVEPVTFSDTTGGGSSLIMCGGVGFGGSTSWNDI
ncbi:hypothetical protein Cantr_05150 [Candida viswanathii]|jgi:hypothetical protein|uniref:Uncharacterized protein n=1 Tax=Candida viswanathii TaxID=5486 RepID=A0A367XSJ3_9ASCO|nr:hypothetical protein Cantr_05150 [Candida viswanathii]